MRPGKRKHSGAKKSKMKLKILTALVLAGAVMFSQRAEANAVIPSTLHMTGFVEWDVAGQNVQFLSAAVAGGSGIYAGLAEGTTVDFTDFTYDPFTPVEPLWVIGGGYRFDLVELTYTLELPTIPGSDPAQGLLNLSGLGTAYAPGYAPVRGSWTLTAQGPLTEFSFSSTTRAEFAAVPDGGSTLLLLGSIVTMLGFFGRRTVVS
jgi:hypothetical protein